jgi:hypothetical protein
MCTVYWTGSRKISKYFKIFIKRITRRVFPPTGWLGEEQPPGESQSGKVFEASDIGEQSILHYKSA